MKIELVFIPVPGAGHLRSTVELAKKLIGSDDRLSITVIIIPIQQADAGDTACISFTAVPQDRLRYESIAVAVQNTDARLPTQVYIGNQKPRVREAVKRIVARFDSAKLGGFVVDMFCSSMIDLADEFGVPAYMAYTSNATFLGITLYLQMMSDEKKYDVSELGESVSELEIPCLTRPYPVKCLPYIFLSKEWMHYFFSQARNFRRMKGILVNTVAELEPHALRFFSGEDLPRVYPVGPVLHLTDSGEDKQSEVLRWLDEQRPESVVFLCFGSMGGFTKEQTREIAVALERSGQRFLWSLRRPKSFIKPERHRDYTDLEEVLPEGFLDRTSDRGKVIGWAPQVAVLRNPAMGGFVTHCGWNSMLESLWFGVPMATWPLYGEQKVNAFAMVEELGLAVEIRKYVEGDSMAGTMEMVTAEDIEKAVRRLMEVNSDVRKRVKEMSDKCHVALMDGGSSQTSLEKFIEDVVTLTQKVVA